MVDIDSSECEIANTIEKKYGIEACCHPKQLGAPCPSLGTPDECMWSHECSECGEKTVETWDPCFGWHSLCLNPDCEVDK